MVKNLPGSARDVRDMGFLRGLGRSPREISTLVFLPGEFHGQRRLAGYSPEIRTELVWVPPETDH